MKHLSTVGTLLLILMVGWIALNTPQNPNPGLLNLGYNEPGESQYTQYTGAISTTTVVFTGPGTFDGLLVTEDAANATVFWDATSSAAITAGVFATRIADFEAATAEGWYPVNVGVRYGLTMQSTDGFTQAGDWTVLYKK